MILEVYNGPKRVRLKGNTQVLRVRGVRPSLRIPGKRMLALQPLEGEWWPFISNGKSNGGLVASVILFPEEWTENVPGLCPQCSTPIGPEHIGCGQ